ncbi:MAG TPA: NADAR family protein [Candidatus Kapabacteria bacterium]|nr:NADAR family protein [Candidatus Kapabacteria bacterium]
MERFTFFYRSSHPFSQWHPSRFVLDGHAYNCAEQYMMHRKALLFGDRETAVRIMAAGEPREQKALGRLVRGFVEDEWNAYCRDIVFNGNHGKFTQNERLKSALLETAGTTLVEASPTDRIWGIGLEENDPRALNRATWRGTNWLGEALTRLRDELLAGR